MIPEHSTAATAALPTKAAKRKHAPSRYDDNPKSGPVHVRRFTESGVECVSVPLFGRGYGKFMILDAADWEAIQAKGWPECWILSGAGHGYVSSAQSAVRYLSGQTSQSPLAMLARLLTGAERGDHVHYHDRDPLNLRRSNLRLERRAKRPSRAKAPPPVRH